MLNLADFAFSISITHEKIPINYGEYTLTCYLPLNLFFIASKVCVRRKAVRLFFRILVLLPGRPKHRNGLVKAVELHLANEAMTVLYEAMSYNLNCVIATEY